MTSSENQSYFHWTFLYLPQKNKNCYLGCRVGPISSTIIHKYTNAITSAGTHMAGTAKGLCIPHLILFCLSAQPVSFLGIFWESEGELISSHLRGPPPKQGLTDIKAVRLRGGTFLLGSHLLSMKIGSTRIPSACPYFPQQMESLCSYMLPKVQLWRHFPCTKLVWRASQDFLS